MLQNMIHRTLSVRFPLFIWTPLVRYAQEQQSDVGRIVKLAVMDYLRRHGCEVVDPELQKTGE